MSTSTIIDSYRLVERSGTFTLSDYNRDERSGIHFLERQSVVKFLKNNYLF
jgi:hypothetical protein